jgi:hypothetical protein
LKNKKSKLAQSAYEEDSKICWKEANVLHSVFRKYQEEARMVLADYPINQHSLDISTIWTPIIEAVVSTLQFRPV